MSWQLLLTYWRDKHAGSTPPARADLDPLAEITALVPNLFLIDVIRDTFKMRLVGSEIMLRAGVDQTGMIMESRTVEARGIEVWLGYLRRAVRDCTPILYGFAPGDHAAPPAIGIVVPLVNDGIVDMLLGGLFFDPAFASAEQPPLFSWELTELAIPADLSEQPVPIRASATKPDTSASS
jgi:hypothetical protein